MTTKRERKENKTRDCQLCGGQFQRGSGRFETVCNRCTQENDNQTLEALLSVPGDPFEPRGLRFQRADVEHTPSCQRLIDRERDCSCGADDLDVSSQAFFEAMN